MISRAEHLLEARLDDRLAPGEHAELERLLEARPELRVDLEQLERVTEALRRLVRPPATARLAALLPGRVLREVRPWPMRRRVALAASLAAAALGVWLILDAAMPRHGAGYRPPPQVTLEQAYRGQATGGVPLWRCETEAEFAIAFASRLGQPLALADPPAGTEALGLSYCHAITPLTTCLLGRVDGQPVLVLVDRLERDRGQTLPEGEGLRLFHRVIGRLVLYEVTPREEPALLPLFYLPEAP